MILSLCVCLGAVFQVDRKVAHELAAHYGLVSQSFDLEPKRYVSVIKQKVKGYKNEESRGEGMCLRTDGTVHSP